MIRSTIAIVYPIAFLLYLKSIHANESRRILHGSVLSSFEKPFVVYIIKGRKHDDGWICGGAIVKPSYILTAAACVDQNIPLYVIAGTKTYVRPGNWGSGQCIPHTKRKIVKMCRPKDYTFDPNDFLKWAQSDIAVAQVDPPYDFTDTRWRLHCDYTPKPIRINYDIRYQEPGRYCFIYGWGHRYGRHRPKDLIIYNQKVMRYANTMIFPKSECLKVMSKNHQDQVTLNSTFCTSSGHPYNQDFNPFYLEVSTPKRALECKEENRKSNAYDPNCYNETYSDDDFSDEDFNFTDSDGRRRDRMVASGGLCENDHGAPLTTFVGTEEILIGIGIAPIYDKKYRCIEPSLFTSTFYMSMFLRCVFNEPPLFLTRKMCQEYTKKEGFFIEEIDKNFSYSSEE